MNKLNQITTNHRINPAGEGGEFETLTLDGPNFLYAIKINQCKSIWKRDHGYLQIEEAHLESN